MKTVFVKTAVLFSGLLASTYAFAGACCDAGALCCVMGMPCC